MALRRGQGQRRSKLESAAQINFWNVSNIEQRVSVHRGKMAHRRPAIGTIGD